MEHYYNNTTHNFEMWIKNSKHIMNLREVEGGLISSSYSWPPRSYSCSFCRREFRSAQALGGHMNVHRRDRAARLKQSSASNTSPPQPNIEDQKNTISKLRVGVDLVVDGNCCKRHKKSTNIGVSPILPLFHNKLMCSTDHHRFSTPISSSSMEDDVVDLELRLGDRG